MAGGAVLGAVAVDMGRVCGMERGAGAGAVGREGALGPRAGADRPPRERGMVGRVELRGVGCGEGLDEVWAGEDVGRVG